MACSKMISFAEIVQGRDASVRVTDDRLLYAVDLAMVGTGHSRDQAAQVTRNIPENLFPSSKFIERQIHAGHPTKLLNIDDSIQFIMVLPGHTATVVRQQFGKIIKRHFGGDQSLHAEIDANATSNSPIAQMARESLGMTGGDKPGSVGFKRRREELELLKLEEEVKGMTQARIKLEEEVKGMTQARIKLEEEIKGMTQARILGLKTELEQLSDSSTTTLDEPTRLMFKDTLQSLLVNNTKTAPLETQKQIKPTIDPAQEIFKRFLSTLADTSAISTKFAARDLHKQYMDYHSTTGLPAHLMMSESAFGRELKRIPGFFKTRTKMCILYTLDHAAIKQSLALTGQ